MTDHLDRPCPCGIGSAFGTHCGPVLDGEAALTAEDLMRSRYTAHVTGHTEHLARTWHTDSRPEQIDAEPDVRWCGLEIHRVERGNALDADGLVEFTAAYERGGRQIEMREISRFARQRGRWVYVDGVRPV